MKYLLLLGLGLGLLGCKEIPGGVVATDGAPMPIVGMEGCTVTRVNYAISAMFYQPLYIVRCAGHASVSTIAPGAKGAITATALVEGADR